MPNGMQVAHGWRFGCRAAEIRSTPCSVRSSERRSKFSGCIEVEGWAGEPCRLQVQSEAALRYRFQKRGLAIQPWQAGLSVSAGRQ